MGDNAFGSTPESLDRYFLAFAVAARETRPTQTKVDRTEIRRVIRMSDTEREAYFLASNRNMLRMFADARRSG